LHGVVLQHVAPHLVLLKRSAVTEHYHTVLSPCQRDIDSLVVADELAWCRAHCADENELILATLGLVHRKHLNVFVFCDFFFQFLSLFRIEGYDS
jgi:hypothetical protein